MVVAQNNAGGKLPDMDASRIAYIRDIKGFQALSVAEERALFARIRQGDRRALNTLIEANLKFVVSVCRNYEGRGLPMADLVNEGNLGLVRAIRHFDLATDYKFISYAVWWVRQAILSALARQSGSITLSPFQVDAIKKLRRESSRIANRLGRWPGPAELARATGLPLPTIDRFAQSGWLGLPCDAASDHPDHAVLESVVDDGNGPEEKTQEQMVRRNLGGVLDGLDERTRDVIRMYYGIGYAKPFDLGEIGERFELSRERVRQIKEKGLKQLRRPAGIRALT